MQTTMVPSLLFVMSSFPEDTRALLRGFPHVVLTENGLCGDHDGACAEAVVALHHTRLTEMEWEFV